MNDSDIKRLARRTAKLVRLTFKNENGRNMTEDDLSTMTMVDISDLCRDAAWDVCEASNFDFEADGMDLTEHAETVLMHWFAPAVWEA